MAVRNLNANAESMGSRAALNMNVSAASGLQDVMKTNLGPRGTIKMLVSGAGDLKLTKARSGAAEKRRRGEERREEARLSRALSPGRQRAAARDADPEPDSDHDRAHSGRAGRHHGVRAAPFAALSLARACLTAAAASRPSAARQPRI